MKQLMVPLIISCSLFGIDFSHIEEAKKQLADAIHGRSNYPSTLGCDLPEIHTLGKLYCAKFHALDPADTDNAQALIASMKTIPQVLLGAYQKTYEEYAAANKERIEKLDKTYPRRPPVGLTAREKEARELHREAINKEYSITNTYSINVATTVHNAHAILLYRALGGESANAVDQILFSGSPHSNNPFKQLIENEFSEYFPEGELALMATDF